ncbi:bifunctional serine/threonine-protein kinase/ABC transporter substrate-binding protein [Streptomyces sp. WAC07149]|uniref:bifunctional serine/threonine-protein kinase/ABC transporter substrate-binding protein n=1 Tax=Streptomyces sp. WAC07149 TaxID=2487425 RepID=UPI00163CD6F0|nr:bifunctional serine/threonine-protein kinase/ABC transporter substrate-binding protein [Streptomyces sp. WAC07149]
MTEQTPELIAGRYELLERIGQGGMGRVWRGADRQLFGREVAIKEILFPTGLEEGDRAGLLGRFTAEARAAVTISHPGIITVHDVVEHHGAPVIVMEYIRGESLAAAIRGRGRLPVERVAEIGSALLDALAEAHGARIVHRDIKPDNVLLTKDRVVLTDFGIAHLADATTRLSHSGIVIGTPQYMAPEQLEGRRPTAANDLWALGATLYHAVEGRPPFEAEGLHALAVAVFTRPHRPPVHAGPLAPVLDALLTKDPERRIGLAEASALLASVLRSPRQGPGSATGAEPAEARPDDTRPDEAAPAEAGPGQARPDETAPDEAGPGAACPDDAAPHEAGPGTARPDGTRPDGTHPDGTRPDEAGPDGTGTAVLPGPDRPTVTAAPVPPAGELVTLGPTDPDRGDERTPARPRALGRRFAVWGVALATLAAGSALTWTLNRDHSSGSGSGTGTGTGGSGASSVTVVIGVDAPLSGDLSSFGAGIRNSADLAARTANRTRHVPGVNFEVKALDDEAAPAKGAPNAARFVADEKVLGVVGPFTSAVARTFVEPLARANLVNVSPSNTDPALTLGPQWAKGTASRPYGTYFRTVATDVDQGPFAARHLHDEAGKTKLYVVDDSGAYGAGLASGFTDEFRKLGGSVVGADHVDPAQSGFSALASKIRASGAEAVYFGGYHTTAAPLSRQLKEAGVTVPLVGGDGIFDQQYLTANPKADGDLATNIGEPVERLARGDAFLADYRAAGYPEAAGAYGPSAYDAAWTLVEAVKAVVAANGGTLPADARARMARAVSGLGFDGVTGRVAFDEYGDARNRRLTVYTVTGGTWTTVTSGPRTP